VFVMILSQTIVTTKASDSGNQLILYRDYNQPNPERSI